MSSWIRQYLLKPTDRLLTFTPVTHGTAQTLVAFRWIEGMTLVETGKVTSGAHGEASAALISLPRFDRVWSINWSMSMIVSNECMLAFIGL